MKSIKQDTNSNEELDFKNEYDTIIRMSENTVIVDIEWTENGDYFKKFTTYEDYTPVKTSSSTELISNI